MKKLFIVFAVVLIGLLLIKQKDMTFRQSFMKFFYPAIMWVTGIFGGKKELAENTNMQQPTVSFYTLQATANNNTVTDFSQYKGKTILIVNTASDCGFTGQFSELETLYQQHKDSLVILGFPANDFKGQEKKNDEQIAEFCKVNYGVNFPLMKKSKVVKGDGQNNVYQWLTNPKQNGWCSKTPTWNFSKYIINKDGVLTHFFAHTVSPLDSKVQKALFQAKP
jgi:glutathione peroxidase